MFCRRRNPTFDVSFAKILVVLFARILDELALLSRQHALVLPRPRVDDRIVDRDGVRDVLGVDSAKRLREVQLIAMWMTDGVEASPAVETACVDDERVAIPLADGSAEPLRIRILRRGAAVGRYDVEPVVHFEEERDVVAVLDNLKWIGGVHRSAEPEGQT